MAEIKLKLPLMRCLPGLTPEFKRADLREVDVKLNWQGLGGSLLAVTQERPQWGQGSRFLFVKIYQLSHAVA